MRARISFWAQLGQDTFDCPVRVFGEVRNTMLGALSSHCGQAQPLLEMDIRAARDLAELWYLRPRLLQAISACDSADAAGSELHKITQLFNGHFDQAIHSRFG